jgi:hypothetical protein
MVIYVVCSRSYPGFLAILSMGRQCKRGYEGGCRDADVGIVRATIKES